MLAVLGAMLLLPAGAHAQAVIAGRITSNGLPLAHAQVGLLGSRAGATANSEGRYRIAGVPAGRHTLVVRFLGFAPAARIVEVGAGDTVEADIALDRAVSVLDAVVTTGTLQERYVSESPVKVDVLTERFLERNVTNNLMDNLPFVTGLTQQVDCGVCFTNNIRINGMEGPYTAVLIDGTPVMSSLATVYGLNGLNPAIIQQVEVIKGPASTLYGTEAMGGVINIITKDPRFAPRYSVNTFGSSHGEVNIDAAAAPRIGGAYTLISGNLSYNDQFIDENGDNFSDLPLNRRLSLFNKWSFGSAERRTLDLTARYYYEDRFGGTREWTRDDRGSSERYGESIYTGRAELIGSYRLPFENESARLWFSANHHDQDSWYGDQHYAARQTVLFGQLVWDRTFGDRHDALFGATMRYQTYDDDTPATREDDRRWIPGVFVQDEMSLGSRLVGLGGLRIDHHREHGAIFSPRLNIKWQPGGDEETTIRLNAATGFRVVNLFTEDHAAVTGARRVVVSEALDPERSVNVTVGLNQHVHFGSPLEGLIIDLDAFHTRFSNKIQPDYDTDPNAIIYGNLDGHAVTRGVSLSVQLDAPTRPYTMALGATLQNVFIQSEGERRALEFAPDFQGTISAGYAFRSLDLGLDYTGRIVGPMQLPTFPGRARRSPWYGEHHVQATRAFATGVEVYAAVKNLFDYQQQDPLIDPGDPFGDTFDTFYVYGPVQGRRFVLGARYSVGR
jgi:outer membrane receptor for ferrienterochelin and colicins